MSSFWTILTSISVGLGLPGVLLLLYAALDGQFSVGSMGRHEGEDPISPRHKNRIRLTGLLLILSCVGVIGGAALWDATNGKKDKETEAASQSSRPSPSGKASTKSPAITDPPTSISPTPTPTAAPSESPEPEKVSLTSLTPLDENVNMEPTSLGGKEYLDLVRVDPSKCNKVEADYNLGKKYTRFTATTGLYDDYNERDAPSWIFAVYTNNGNGDRELFKRIMKFGDTQPIDVSVKNALRLKLVIQWVDPGYSITCSPLNSYAAVWANPTLTP